MAISTSALALSFLYFTIPALSLYSPSGAVPLLNPKTFDQKIRNSKHASMVEFFAPWSHTPIAGLMLVGAVIARTLLQGIPRQRNIWQGYSPLQPSTVMIKQTDHCVPSSTSRDFPQIHRLIG
jgi:hypothetical protein